MANLDRDRFIRVLGMLGSVHDGEIVNAARLAQGMLTGAGMMWSDIVAAHPRASPPPPPPPPPPQPPPRDDEEVGELVDDCLTRHARLPFVATEWEEAFLSDIRRRFLAYGLTEKQVGILKRIHAKFQRYEQQGP